jgi:hypothetical protein
MLSFSLLHFDQVNQNTPVVQCLHRYCQQPKSYHNTLLSLIESGILRQMFGSLLTKVQYSSLDLSESQQENAEDSDVRDERERINKQVPVQPEIKTWYTEKSGFVLFFVCLCLYMYRFNIVLLYILLN